jgi:AdoMet-dependent heme synthase
LLRQIVEFGDPLPQLILTGGDPLARADLYDLIDTAHELGIGVSITPAATPALTADVLLKLQQHGVEGLGLSLDGSTAQRHDSIRGVPGTFDLTMQAMQWAKELGMPLQVNTLVAAETAADIPAIYELLRPLNVARWSLFFLISVGRGKVLQPLSAEEAERLMGWIYETSTFAPFAVATTEAPSYRRVALNRMRADGLAGDQIKKTAAYRGFGILPLAAGNVRRDRLPDIYRNAPLFQALHDSTRLHGRCGYCEYHALCGGSRARAYAATGDPLGQDPLCVYEPHACA